jgi:hypothetical protein
MMEQYLTDSLSEASQARANEIQKRVIVDTSTDYIWDLDI